MKQKCYRYKALAADGKLQQGKAEAANQLEVVKMLERQGLQAVSISHSWAGDLGGSLGRDKADIGKRIFLYRQLSVMVGAGLPIHEALTVARKSPGMDGVVGKILRLLGEGMSLSGAFGKGAIGFGDRELALIAAGEQSGELQQVFLQLSEQLEKEHGLKKRLGAIMLYPSLLVVGCILLVVFLLKVMLPVITTVIHGKVELLPWPTRILLQSMDGLIILWPQMMVVLLFVLLLILALGKCAAARCLFHKWMLYCPVLGRIRLYAEWGNTLKSLAMLLDGGIVVDSALDIVSRVPDNAYLAYGIKEMAKSIGKGGSISGALTEVQMPEMVKSMIAAGEAVGELGSVMAFCGEYCLQEAEKGIKAAEVILEPAIMIVMGIIVGFVVLSVVMPMLDAMVMFV